MNWSKTGLPHRTLFTWLCNCGWHNHEYLWWQWHFMLYIVLQAPLYVLAVFLFCSFDRRWPALLMIFVEASHGMFGQLSLQSDWKLGCFLPFIHSLPTPTFNVYTSWTSTTNIENEHDFDWWFMHIAMCHVLSRCQLFRYHNCICVATCHCLKVPCLQL